jgi:hypothetical protein
MCSREVALTLTFTSRWLKILALTCTVALASVNLLPTPPSYTLSPPQQYHPRPISAHKLIMLGNRLVIGLDYGTTYTGEYNLACSEFLS